MLFKVDIYHNETTVSEAVEAGEAELALLLPARKDMPAIFARAFGDTRTHKGDRLHLILSLNLEAESTVGAAEAAFAAGNSPYDDDDGVLIYRAKMVRSLSCGDVVVVHSPDGPATYSCESIGWESVDFGDFAILAPEKKAI